MQSITNARFSFGRTGLWTAVRPACSWPRWFKTSRALRARVPELDNRGFIVKINRLFRL